MNENEFNYYYGNESEQFIFYRIPKVLFTDDRFKKLSTEAKVLYGLMLDRMGLSIKNQWCDDDNRVFIIYTQEESMEHLNCNTEKIVKLYKELDDIGLIERKRQGQGKPTWIYVKNFIINHSSNNDSQTFENRKSRTSKTESLDLGKSKVKNFENRKSRASKIESADFRKSKCNNTDINDTDNSNTESNKTDQNDIDSLSHGINHINQSAENSRKDSDDDVVGKMERYRQIIKDNIEYDIMIQNHKKDFVDELVELMTETICFPKSSYYINDRELPSELIKSRLLKLNVSHMEYVIECMKGNHTKISNIRNYLISALYNSFTTMDSYYRADYNASPLSQL